MQYACPPLGRDQLRGYAWQVRKKLQLDRCAWLPVMDLLDGFHKIINDDDFYFEVVDDDYFERGKHAAYFPEDNCIRIKNSVYLSADEGNGRDRMTIAHELAHVLLLKVCNIQLYRCFEEEPIKPYRDPEWQAKCLAGEWMIPYYLVKNMTVEEIAEQCGVSYDAAAFQKSKFK